MTRQVLDLLEYQGKQYFIDNQLDSRSEFPSNPELGIDTCAPHTANYSGRINYLGIHNAQLYLDFVQACLSPAHQQKRERYPRVTHEQLGWRRPKKKSFGAYTIFDTKLSLQFTGILELRDHEQPETILLVRFTQGRPVAEICHKLSENTGGYLVAPRKPAQVNLLSLGPEPEVTKESVQYILRNHMAKEQLDALLSNAPVALLAGEETLLAERLVHCIRHHGGVAEISF